MRYGLNEKKNKMKIKEKEYKMNKFDKQINEI
jgi:hypothetical protein